MCLYARLLGGCASSQPSIQAKKRNHEHMTNHKKMLWQLECHDKALEAADAFLATFASVTTRDQCERLLNDLRAFQRRSAQKFRIDETQAVSWCKNCRDVCLSADGMRGDRVLQGQIADAMIVGGEGKWRLGYVEVGRTARGHCAGVYAT